MVHSQIGFLKNWGQLKLIGGNFIVTGFYRNAQKHTLRFQMAHKVENTRRNGTKIMIVQLLSLCRRMAQQSSSSQRNIWTGCRQSTIYKKIFLFPAQGCIYLSNVFIKIFCHSSRCIVNSL